MIEQEIKMTNQEILWQVQRQICEAYKGIQKAAVYLDGICNLLEEVIRRENQRCDLQKKFSETEIKGENNEAV